MVAKRHTHCNIEANCYISPVAHLPAAPRRNSAASRADPARSESPRRRNPGSATPRACLRACFENAGSRPVPPRMRNARGVFITKEAWGMSGERQAENGSIWYYIVSGEFGRRACRPQPPQPQPWWVCSSDAGGAPLPTQRCSRTHAAQSTPNPTMATTCCSIGRFPLGEAG